MKFHIITAMYNVEEWIEENIQLLKNQTYTNFQVVLVDDISTDKNYGENKSEKWHTRLIRDILSHKKPYNRLDQL
jgi:glycosyltransferase involved in cell wall biosynthesis